MVTERPSGRRNVETFSAAARCTVVSARTVPSNPISRRPHCTRALWHRCPVLSICRGSRRSLNVGACAAEAKKGPPMPPHPKPPLFSHCRFGPLDFSGRICVSLFRTSHVNQSMGGAGGDSVSPRLHCSPVRNRPGVLQHPRSTGMWLRRLGAPRGEPSGQAFPSRSRGSLNHRPSGNRSCIGENAPLERRMSGDRLARGAFHVLWH